MEQNTKSSICVRLTPKCRDSVELVVKNLSSPKQIRLINRNSNDFVLYEFDEIYGKDSTNEKLYENMIFTEGMNSLIDLESGLYCFLGSQGVGKTFTMTGELNNLWENSGLLSYLMQEIFQDSVGMKSQAKIFPLHSKNNTVELRFLQILGDNVENIGFETVYGESTNEREIVNRIDYKIDIKNLTHFQNCINKIYERKKPHMHLVIQVTLKNEPLIYTTKKTILTFIEISSACFDEGNVHAQKIKTEVQALISIFQNIQRIKHLEHLFEGSKLTKLLKNNFFEAKKANLIGILDNSFKGNHMTLKWLKMSLELKEDKTIIENMKEDIKKEEQYLKSLMEKHKKAMTLLSKCIGTELSFWEKQKNFAVSKRQIDFGFGNSFNKRCEKIKLANIKKLQNEQEIERLNKQIATIEEEIDFMDCEHKEAMKKLQEEKNEILTVKNRLIAKMEEITQQLIYKNVFNGNGVGNNTGNSLFWRPSLSFDNTGDAGGAENEKKVERDTEGNPIKKQHSSRNSSFKVSVKKINNANKTRTNLAASSPTKIQRKRLNQDENQEGILLQIKRQQSFFKNETKRQIYELFKLISEQQKCLDKVVKSNTEKLSTGMVNRIKNRQQQQGLGRIEQDLINKYLREGKQFELGKFSQFAQNQKAFIKISKDMLSKETKTQQTTETNIGRA